MPTLDTNKESTLTRTSEAENKSFFSFLPGVAGTKPVSRNKESGFTLFLAVIVTSVVILLGITIAGILQREALLSVSSQASTEAFYAADTALECSMYYDRSRDAFSTSSPNVAIVECLGVNASDRTTDGSDYADPYERSFLLDGAGICAGVQIEKYLIDGEERTFVEARGRNTCDNNALNRAERALRTAY